jgi:hypothetical protein
MAGPAERSVGATESSFPPRTVRVLRDDAELEEAVARAAECASRLHDRLAARAARDAWMAEQTERRVAWLQLARGAGGPSRLLTPLGAKPAGHPGSASSAA